MHKSAVPMAGEPARLRGWRPKLLAPGPMINLMMGGAGALTLLEPTPFSLHRGGEIGSRKGLNIPSPALTRKDLGREM